MPVDGSVSIMRKFIFRFFISIFSLSSAVLLNVGEVFSQCTLGATTSQTNILCNGANTGAASVAVTGGTLPYTYSWSTGSTTSAISNLSAGTYTSTVIDASCILSGVELVTNGDFSAGNSGFISTYTACVPNCAEGSYAVGTDPNVVHSSWSSCPDHTSGSGNYMILNGAPVAGVSVWCETVTVIPNTNYNFSTWVVSQYTVSPAELQFSINGIPLCNTYTASSTACVWTQFFCVWNSGASTTANICILNQNTALAGNDFGLDDISFMSCAPCTLTNSVTITEPLPLSITGNSTSEFCNRADGTATVIAAGGNGAYTYVWTPPVSTTGNVTGLVAGNYSVTVSDANGCSKDTMLVVNFTPGPTANAGTDVSMCSGSTITLGASGGGSYLWNPSSGLSSTTNASPTFSSSASTTYTVTVTDINGCTDTDDVAVSVYISPEVSFLSTSTCFTNPTVFTDNTTGNAVQWNWNFGEPSSGINNTSTLQNPTHTYNSPGTFMATLISTTPEGCSDTTFAPVTVYPLPVTSFSSTTVCIGTPTNFTDQTTVSSGTITAWNWNFGDPGSGANNISNIQNPTHIFSAVGNFNVLLTVTSGNGCQSTTILQAVVMFPPIASFTFTNSCLNTNSTFTDQSSNTTGWYWTFGDGGTSNSQNPTHVYAGFGSYVVTLIASSTGTCADTISDTVLVYPLPVTQFLSDTVCLGDSSTFFNLSYISTGNISGWHWDFGDGDSSSLQNPAHVFPSAGNFTVTLTATTANGCVSSVVDSTLVHPLPTAGFSFTPSPAAQLIDAVNFVDLSTGGAVLWWWDFGDGDTSLLQNPSHFFSDTGAFVVTLAVTSVYGCVDTVKHEVEVRDFAFYIPNSFSPNGDGLNELFFGKGVGILEYELIIFDRWGNRIFYCKVRDLPQTLPCMWDGKVEGGTSNKPVQEDVYVWKVNLISIFNMPYNYIGNVTVVR